MILKLFRWLQEGTPRGNVEILPKVESNYSTNLPGVYIIGDLTGVPLLKLAGNSGIKVWENIKSTNSQTLDAIIIGGGISGISCAIEGQKLGKKFILLESNEIFHTIKNYPKGKPIFAEPEDLEIKNYLPIKNGIKESFLEDLYSEVKKFQIPIKENSRVIEIQPTSKGYKVITESNQTYEAPNLIIAIGKSGDPKKLGILGEDLPHVSYRFLDPEVYKDEEVVIVGGGDSALEAGIFISNYARKVTLMHRNIDFSKAKQENQKKIFELFHQKKIDILFESQLKEIQKDKVLVETSQATKEIPASQVLVLIGSNPPIALLEKMGITIEGKKTKSDWAGLFSLLGFATLVYFGKSAFYGSNWMFWIANVGFGIFLCSFLYYLFLKYKSLLFRKLQINSWNFFSNFYLALVVISFTYIYYSSYLNKKLLFDKYPAFYYTLLYSLTIVVFGIRRIYIRKTKYIFLQTISLIFIQVFFLFLLPEIILPYLGSKGLLGTKDGFFLTQVFPNEAYWKAYGFILAWPLNMSVLYDNQITTFWLCYGFGFTFVLIPTLVYYFGKGAYCGWICSCGGLAETLGDEHRTKMPHGEFAYKIEHSGQIILLFALIFTIFKLLGKFFLSINFLESVSDSIKWIYDLVVDIGLAGVVGVGFYFFYSGRVWCRMFCPLAALMHIYAKFSSFRIFSDKKKCISCNICTKNCHQGIDVMNYANKGIPMDSVQCVRCSACVSMCPTKVLSFGRLVNNVEKIDSLSGQT